MLKVGVVYNIVRDLCNKDQKGFVTPAVFNTLAEAAQMNVYNEMFNELKLATRLRRSGSDAGRDKSAYKMVEEDLAYFISTKVLNVAGEEPLVPALDPDGNPTYEEDGVTPIMQEVEEVAKVSKPYDLYRIISMNVFETNTSVEIIYDAEKAKRVFNSNLSAPTEEFPIALIEEKYIEIFPQTISSDINIKYYRKPDKPIYGVLEISDGFVIQNPASSRDFDLPDHYLTEVVGEIARMIGVRLRDDVLTQYGVAETTNR
tara:strand:+ start:138 stop:914 length:777 start_codon:yes stop_codon:yes gene_type:complete